MTGILSGSLLSQRPNARPQSRPARLHPDNPLCHTPPVDAPLQFAAALSEVFQRLDWTALGQHYCFEGGEDFFDEPARESLFEAQITFASEIVETLQSGDFAGAGRSLYVGAALSELGPMLGETLLLNRTIEAFSLDNPETRELNRALSEVASELGLELPIIQTIDLHDANLVSCDHVWMVSILNDPEAFPALHDKLYEREGTDLAMNAGDLATDEERATRLCTRVLQTLVSPGLLTTSDEEFPLVDHIACDLELSLEALTDSFLSPLVEDPVRLWRVK